MIVRTPPPQKRHRAEEEEVDERRLVIYEAPISSLQQVPSPHHDDLHHPNMVCTYQCRQMVKSEFMQALNNAEKQSADYQCRLDALTNDLYKNEEEKMKCQDQIRYLEQELAASKGFAKALEERLLKEVDDSLEKYQSLAKQNSDLEAQLKKEVQDRRKAEFAVSTAENNASSLEQKVLQLSENLEREKRRFHMELSEYQDEAKRTHSRLSRELEQMRVRADCAMQETELLRKQLDELGGQLNEVRTEKSHLEQKFSNHIVMPHPSAPPDNQDLVKHLQDALRNYESEVQEARQLKSYHVNIELLKEKVLEEKVRRERAEEQLLQLQEIELNANKMKDELVALKFIVSSIPGISSFEEIPQKVATLQQEAIDSMKEVGDTKERLKGLEIALESANLSRKQAETECALAKEKTETLTSEVNQLKKMLQSVTEERESFKRDALASFTQRNTEKDREMDAESFAKKMESVIAEKDSIIKELETDLQERREIINNKNEELRLAHERFNIEEKRIKSLEREGDRLRSEISLLESKLGHGDYSSANTKVLRMVNTLTIDNDAKHTIEALRAELQKAQAKLQAVDDLKGQSEAGNLTGTDISEKLADLKGQIATLEKREERYKTVFADRISIFRRACCSLFGYKIIMDDQQRPNGIPVTRFTLQSIYAQTDEEKLEFEYESGNTNILANDYTCQPEISQQVDIFVRKLNSIPAFTANLTVESFNKRTLS